MDRNDENKTIDDELGKKQIIKFLKDQNLELYKDFKMKSLRIEIEDKDKKTKTKYKSYKSKIPITEEQKKLYCEMNNRNDSENIKFVKQVYKISLSDVPINKIYEVFNEKNLKHLSQKYNIHFYDIDFTQAGQSY